MRKESDERNDGAVCIEGDGGAFKTKTRCLVQFTRDGQTLHCIGARAPAAAAAVRLSAAVDAAGRTIFSTWWGAGVLPQQVGSTAALEQERLRRTQSQETTSNHQIPGTAMGWLVH